ncbi:MAG TPA: hypothetical protein VFZ41_08200 [Solirubrobacterales bacterium]
MDRITRETRSPGILVATLALIVALTGTAIAGDQGASISLSKKQVRKITQRVAARVASRVANRQIDRREGGLSVAHADRANTATSSTTAQSATIAASAANALNAGNADQLDGLDADSLVRAAGASTTNAAEGDGDIVSTSITAPGDGYLLIVASVDSRNDVDTDGFDCDIEVDGVPIASAHRSIRVTKEGNNEEDCGTNTVAQVDAGPHVIDFSAGSVGTNVKFEGADLNVLFVPFGPTGG